jgi:FolB domain-containing protein
VTKGRAMNDAETCDRAQTCAPTKAAAPPGTMVVGFKKLRVDCIIGIREHERLAAQPLYFDVQVTLRAADGRATHSDTESSIQVSYSALSKLCSEIAVEGKYGLLETLVEVLCDKVLATYAPCVESVWVRVRKPQALPNGTAFVQLFKHGAPCVTGHGDSPMDVAPSAPSQ